MKAWSCLQVTVNGKRSEMFENYFRKSLGELLPSVLKESIIKSVISQEFISLNRAIKKYNLSRRTLWSIKMWFIRINDHKLSSPYGDWTILEDIFHWSGFDEHHGITFPQRVPRVGCRNIEQLDPTFFLCVQEPVPHIRNSHQGV